MKFKNERLKRALQRRKAKRKLTTQEQYDLKYFQELKEQQDKLKALESRVPEQMVFQFDDVDRLKEIGND
jgi:hypothetical protein